MCDKLENTKMSNIELQDLAATFEKVYEVTEKYPEEEVIKELNKYPYRKPDTPKLMDVEAYCDYESVHYGYCPKCKLEFTYDKYCTKCGNELLTFKPINYCFPCGMGYFGEYCGMCGKKLEVKPK